MNEFVTLIPLRGGSKGIKRKNLIKINKKPLLYYVIKASLDAGIRTVVSTEDSEIKEVCRSLFQNIYIINRPEELARDNSSTEDVIKHFLQTDSKEKNIILLQATSPLTSSKDIKEAINLYKKNTKKSLLSVVQSHQFIWDESGRATNYDPINRPRRQDWDGYYIENGAIYIFSRNQFLKYKSRCSNECTLFKMNTKSLFEIDDESDFKVLSALLEERNNE